MCDIQPDDIATLLRMCAHGAIRLDRGSIVHSIAHDTRPNCIRPGANVRKMVFNIIQKLVYLIKCGVTRHGRRAGM